MATRRLWITALLFCLCLCLTLTTALAASTTEAQTPIAVDTPCDLAIRYGYDDTVFPEQTVALYQIAAVSADYQYTLTPDFAASGLILNGIQSSAEWNTIRATLEARIRVEQIAPCATATTNAQGLAQFAGLKPGLYLVGGLEVTQDNMTYAFASSLIALPELDGEGAWQYQVIAAAKPEVLPPIEPDETIEMNILKLWKGDSSRNDRPESIRVEIYRDQALQETVILSEENRWSYSWSAKDDGAVWTVMEPEVPAGYTMTVEQREATFVITNTRTDSPGPPTPPYTGDTFNPLLYTVLLYLSGMILIILALLGMRKRHEETK